MDCELVAVHEQRRAMDEGGVVRGQEGICSCYLLSCPVTPECSNPNMGRCSGIWNR
jgi:hypothetical protein